MAHTKSQKKRNRQTIVRTERNRSIRSELSTRERAVEEAVAAGDAPLAQERLRIAQKRLDKAATKGVLKANTVSRRKSRLARKVETLTQE